MTLPQELMMERLFKELNNLIAEQNACIKAQTESIDRLTAVIRAGGGKQPIEDEHGVIDLARIQLSLVCSTPDVASIAKALDVQ